MHRLFATPFCPKGFARDDRVICTIPLSVADFDEVQSARRRVGRSGVAIESVENRRDFLRCELAASHINHRRDHRAHHVPQKTVRLDAVEK